MYGQATDPGPYIAAAYFIAVFLIGGFATWIAADRRKTRQMLKTLEQSRSTRN